MKEDIIIRYSASLFEYLKPMPAEYKDRFLSDCKDIESMIIENTDLRNLFYSPAFIEDEKKMVFTEIAENKGYEKGVSNLFMQLIENRKTPAFGEIIEFTEKMINHSLGKIEATVISTAKFSETEMNEIKENLSKALGSAQIVLHQTIDESLMGGAVLKIGNKIYDGSLKGMIQNLKANLMESF